MKFDKKLYTSPNLRKKRSRTKWALQYGIAKADVYVISLAHSNDLLDIYHCKELKQKYYKQFLPHIVGIAESYEEAVKLTEIILLECYGETGSYNVKQFFTE